VFSATRDRIIMKLRAVLLMLFAALAASKMRRADKAAIVHFFKLMGGEHWYKNDGWDVEPGGSDPCDLRTHWTGMGCLDPCDIYRDGPDCAFGRVTALYLRDNNLTGSLTNWTGIGDLHNLTWLDLSVNMISGTLPAEIGNIQNIEVINLAWNKLEGPLPSTLGNINSNGYAHLNELSFEWNNFEGTLPSEIGLLTKLRKLDLGYNYKISGSIPPSVTNLTELQVLYTNGNRMTGELPEQLGNLRDLRFLNFSENNISGTLPPSIGDLTDLSDLTLMHNRISGSLPLEMGNMYSLRYMRINDNELNGNFTKFTTLGNLHSLITLDLYNNRMTGDLPASLQNLTSLQYLYLDNQHYLPLRQYYCRQRLPNNGKYNYRIVRDNYLQMTALPCENMHDTNFAFNSLQESGVYPD